MSSHGKVRGIFSDVHYPTPTGCLFSWLVSTAYQDAMALSWTVSHVMNSTEGTDGKQCHKCPLVNMIQIGFLWLPIWSPMAGTTSHLAKLPGDHLHLYSLLYHCFNIVISWFMSSGNYMLLSDCLICLLNITWVVMATNVTNVNNNLPHTHWWRYFYLNRVTLIIYLKGSGWYQVGSSSTVCNFVLVSLVTTNLLVISNVLNFYWL